MDYIIFSMDHIIFNEERIIFDKDHIRYEYLKIYNCVQIICIR